ncbi:transport protein [Lactiplantibacillus plantarum]|nr:transport protein [Lactiplantibacillus plantarum]
MVESKRNSAKLLWVIGTAWLFDALDVALLSFVMPVIKESWRRTVGSSQCDHHAWHDDWGLGMRLFSR